MLSERKKKVIILALVVVASSIEILVLLYFPFYRSDFGNLLFDIGLTRWGWLPAFGLASTAIVTTLCWKPGSQLLRLFVIFLAAVALILAALWSFGLYFITHLTP